MNTVADAGAPPSPATTAETPRRVLLLIWAGILRGAERHVFDLAAALPAHGYRPTVCFFARADSYGPALRAAGVEFIELDNRNTKWDWRGVRRFVRLLREREFDIVHDHGVALWARPAVRVAAPHVPLVYTEHITRFTPLRRIAYTFLERFTDANIAVSNAARDALTQQLGVAEDSITIVPNSVNPDRFRGITDDARRELKASLGISASSMVLTAVGRLTASKQFDVLIECLADLLRRDAELHLLIVGEGEARQSLTALIAVSGLKAQVHLIGSREDIPDILSASDVFVFASREESFGIAVAEAMLAGIPVVALRIPGVEEVVESGVTGTLIDEGDLRAGFAEAVAQLLMDPERRALFGARGRSRALTVFNPGVAVSRVVDLYNTLLSSR